MTEDEMVNTAARLHQNGDVVALGDSGDYELGLMAGQGGGYPALAVQLNLRKVGGGEEGWKGTWEVVDHQMGEAWDAQELPAAIEQAARAMYVDNQGILESLESMREPWWASERKNQD